MWDVWWVCGPALTFKPAFQLRSITDLVRQDIARMAVWRWISLSPATNSLRITPRFSSNPGGHFLCLLLPPFPPSSRDCLFGGKTHWSGNQPCWNCCRNSLLSWGGFCYPRRKQTERLLTSAQNIQLYSVIASNSVNLQPLSGTVWEIQVLSLFGEDRFPNSVL